MLRTVVEFPGKRRQIGERAVEHLHIQANPRISHGNRFSTHRGDWRAILLDPENQGRPRNLAGRDLTELTLLDQLLQNALAVIVVVVRIGANKARRRNGVPGIEVPAEVTFRLRGVGFVGANRIPADPREVLETIAGFIPLNDEERKQRLAASSTPLGYVEDFVARASGVLATQGNRTAGRRSKNRFVIGQGGWDRAKSAIA